MGRHAGYLAMYVGLAVGATAVLIPEHPLSNEELIEKIRKARLNGFTHYMIVVAEGVAPATHVAKVIKEATDLDPRVTILGHIQRGGAPTARDRVAATKMGYLAVELLMAGKTNRIVCTHEGGFTDIDMDEGLATKKEMLRMEVDVLSSMTGLGQ
jgi:6-phosphofructokinase 1